MADVPPSVKLTYTIAGGSEHSAKYRSENILVDAPTEQDSRWSGASNHANAKQWLLLRLESLAVLKSITFGKFHNPHPCNMKEFKLYVGLFEDNMTEVLHAGLKNDGIPETFSVRCRNHAGLVFPTRYIKIEPVAAHGHSFHVSIWHVALRGIEDPSYVEDVRQKHEEFVERATLRQILKHLRQRRLLGPYQTILSRTGMELEHPLVTSLHNTFVLQGDFPATESVLASIGTASLFTRSILDVQPFAQWSRLRSDETPSPRGGQAMCIDPQNGKIYMFGGWDGVKNLDDFWVFDIATQKWTLLMDATENDPHGPGARACHKMVFDTKSGSIYVFGKLEEPPSSDIGEVPASSSHSSGLQAPTASPIDVRAPQLPVRAPARTMSWINYPAELFRYHTRGSQAGKWELVSADTAAVGGPPLLYDHQMCLDVEAQTMYISGGRVVDGEWDLYKYCGIYSYDIRLKKWKVIQSADAGTMYPLVPSRFGHSMVLDPKLQTLFIFGGQRDDKYLNDMYSYHIPSGVITELYSNFTSAGGPDPCFTQRALIDPELREIYVFCGLSRPRPSGITRIEKGAPYWIYRYDSPERPGKWTKILPSEQLPEADSTPSERYAHQVVYEPRTRTVYMHGGSAMIDQQTPEEIPVGRPSIAHVMRGTLYPTISVPGRSEEEERIEDVQNKGRRLDDFWKMQLVRPSPDDFVRRAKCLVRQQHFRELCEDSTPVKALSYLQTEVSAVVDHNDAEETKTFRALLSHLLSPTPSLPQAPLTRKRSREEADAVPSEDVPMGDAREDTAGVHSVVSMQEDPEERKLNGGKPPSPARFKQRMEVFEQLMVFVNDDAKQPDRDLVRLINVDGDDVF